MMEDEYQLISSDAINEDENNNDDLDDQSASKMLDEASDAVQGSTKSTPSRDSLDAFDRLNEVRRTFTLEESLSKAERLVLNGLQNALKNGDVKETQRVLATIAESPQSARAILTALKARLEKADPHLKVEWETATSDKGEPIVRLHLHQIPWNKLAGNITVVHIGSDFSSSAWRTGFGGGNITANEGLERLQRFAHGPAPEVKQFSPIQSDVDDRTPPSTGLTLKDQKMFELKKYVAAPGDNHLKPAEQKDAGFDFPEFEHKTAGRIFSALRDGDMEKLQQLCLTALTNLDKLATMVKFLNKNLEGSGITVTYTTTSIDGRPSANLQFIIRPTSPDAPVTVLSVANEGTSQHLVETARGYYSNISGESWPVPPTVAFQAIHN